MSLFRPYSIIKPQNPKTSPLDEEKNFKNLVAKQPNLAQAYCEFFATLQDFELLKKAMMYLHHDEFIFYGRELEVSLFKQIISNRYKIQMQNTTLSINNEYDLQNFNQSLILNAELFSIHKEEICKDADKQVKVESQSLKPLDERERNSRDKKSEKPKSKAVDLFADWLSSFELNFEERDRKRELLEKCKEAYPGYKSNVELCVF